MAPSRARSTATRLGGISEPGSLIPPRISDVQGPDYLASGWPTVVRRDRERGASLVFLHPKAWARRGFDLGGLDVVIVLASDLHGEGGSAVVVTRDDGRARWVGAVPVAPLQQS